MARVAQCHVQKYWAPAMGWIEAISLKVALAKHTS